MDIEGGSYKFIEMEVLNSKRVKELLNVLVRDYSVKKIKFDYAFLQDNDSIYAVSKDFLFLNELRMKNAGLFFGKFFGDLFVLSIEGSQLVGNDIGRALEIDANEINNWLKGCDMQNKYNMADGLLVIRHKDDFLGSGRIKEDKIFNLVPKERRVYNTYSISNEGNLA